MIARLRGKLVSVDPHCILDVGGVGFELHIPERDKLALAVDEPSIQFHTYLYVREDRLTLFGFVRREDRDLFTRLIEVSGIGPKVGMGMLAEHSAERVVAAIKGNDVALLRSLPGLGKKTAERVVIELADKLDDVVVHESAAAGSASSSVRDEVIAVLTSLGMSRHSAEDTLDRMPWDPKTVDVEDVVKQALKRAGMS